MSRRATVKSDDVRLEPSIAYTGLKKTLWPCGRIPDKGEVGGSSPPRPTIQIISKYAPILTFSLSGNISQKTNLPTICQLYDWPDGTILGALRPFG